MSAALIWAVACWAGAAADFDPDSTRWNGLQYLRTTAAEAKVGPGCPDDCAPLQILDTLDWSAVTRDDTLIFIDPGASLQPQEVLEFVRDGGTVIIARDVGSDAPIARVFGLELVSEGVIHNTYYRDHPSFPQLSPPEACLGHTKSPDALPPGCHFLWYNVHTLVLNHPAAFVTGASRQPGLKSRPILPFAEPGQAVAVEVRAGDGFALFLSDASVFINDMQRRAYGDKQLVANLLRYYCDDACDPLVLLPKTIAHGRFPSRARAGLLGVRELLATGIDALNALGLRASRWFGQERVLFWGVMLLLIALWFALALLPWPHQTDGFGRQRRADHRPAHAEYWVTALSHARATADFRRAALLLGERFDQAFGHLPNEALGPAALRCRETFNTVRAPNLNAAHTHTVRAESDLRPSAAGAMGLEEFQRLWMDCDQALGGLTLPTEHT